MKIFPILADVMAMFAGVEYTVDMFDTLSKDIKK